MSFRKNSIPSKLKGRISTVVWGKWHTNVFIQYCLRSLLSSNNIPKVALNHSLTYSIVTSKDDAETISQAPAYKQLQTLVKTRLIALPQKCFQSDYVSTHKNFWEVEVDRAKAKQQWIIFMPADNVLSDGSLSHLSDFFLKGKTAVFATGLRVASETFLPEIDSLIPNANTSFTVKPYNLSRLALKHLHPLDACYLEKSPHFCFHAERILYPIKNEGFLLKMPVAPAFGFDPNKIRVSDNFVPELCKKNDSTGFATDPEKFLLCSVTPILKDVSWYVPPLELNVEHMGKWWPVFYRPVHHELSQQSFHYRIQPPLSQEWRSAEMKSARFLANVRYSLHSNLAWKSILRLGCSSAARIWATSYHTLKKPLYRQYNKHLTILVPSDSSFEKLSSTYYTSLAHPSNSDPLKKFVQTHVFEGKIPLLENYFYTSVNSKIIQALSIFTSKLISKVSLILFLFKKIRHFFKPTFKHCFEIFFHFFVKKGDQLPYPALTSKGRKNSFWMIFLFHLPRIYFKKKFSRFFKKTLSPLPRQTCTATNLAGQTCLIEKNILGVVFCNGVKIYPRRMEIDSNIHIYAVSSTLGTPRLIEHPLLPHSSRKHHQKKTQTSPNPPETKDALEKFSRAQKHHVLSIMQNVMEFYTHSIGLNDYAPSLYLRKHFSFRDNPVELLEYCLKTNPQNPSFHFEMATILEESQNESLALKHYLEACASHPTDNDPKKWSLYTRSHYKCGLIYERLGHDDLAYDHYKEAISLNPEATSHKHPFPEAYTRIARIAYRLGYAEDAFKYFDMAMIFTHYVPEVNKFDLN